MTAMRNLLTIFLILTVSFGFSQTKNKQADALFDKMWYVEAAKAYEAAIKDGDISKETLQRTGDCYYFNTNMQEANKWYGKLVSQYPDEVSPEYMFRYAQTLEGA
jgi:tetratricopeptide (TPR) repeat protein